MFWHFWIESFDFWPKHLGFHGFHLSTRSWNFPPKADTFYKKGCLILNPIFYWKTVWMENCRPALAFKCRAVFCCYKCKVTLLTSIALIQSYASVTESKIWQLTKVKNDPSCYVKQCVYRGRDDWALRGTARGGTGRGRSNVAAEPAAKFYYSLTDPESSSQPGLLQPQDFSTAGTLTAQLIKEAINQVIHIMYLNLLPNVKI